MIKLFNSTDTLFSSNGDKVIIPTKAKIHKEDNGSFYLDLETNLDYINELVQGKIIVAPTPQGDQAFRVGNVSKTRRKLSTRCYHVFYDTQNYLIEDSYVVDKDCNGALEHLNSATDNPSPFITISDITTIDSFRCVRKSLYEAIQTVNDRWGGHLVRDNFTIKVMNTIGQDNGVTVRYAKNLKDITCEENWNDVVTKLMPVGKDGLMLPEVYLYSDTQYSIPYTKTVSFEQNNVLEDDYKDSDGNTDTEAYQNALIENLREQATTYLNTNCIPKVNYTLKANLEKISDIGDVVEVIDERLGIDINTNIISYDYDCILGKYTELEFGNFTQNLSNLISSITSSTTQQIQTNNNNLQVTISQSIASATDTIWQALGSSYVIYDGDKILVLDAIPKENAKNVIMINAGGIGFSQSGINGPFQSAWTIDNVLNMEQINVINMSCNLLRGGTLKLGSNINQNGQIEVYDEANNLIAKLDKNGLIMYGLDGSYLVVNNSVGFAGYDRTGAKTFWVSGDEFHQKKSVIEEEITLCNKARFIPITVKDGDTVTNDGIGIVGV